MSEGDCYEAAALLMVALPSQARDSARLCHGTVIGNAAPVLGIPFGHAWVEIGDTVFDNSNGGQTVTRASVYYQRGTIDPATVTCYTWAQTAHALVSTEHYGPWEG